MAKPRVPSLSSSLADKLKAAGVMDEAAAAAVEASRREATVAARLAPLEAGRRAKTIAGICSYYVRAAESGETLEALLAWGASWFDELEAAGHAAELKRQRILRPGAVHVAMEEDAIDELQERLGCSLPPSLRRMLAEHGGLEWGPQHTLPAGQMVEQQVHLRALLATFAAPLPELSPYAAAELQLIPLAQLDGNFDFALGNDRGTDGEAPIYFVYHDEAHLYGGERSVEEWLATKLEVMMERFADRAARG